MALQGVDAVGEVYVGRKMNLLPALLKLVRLSVPSDWYPATDVARTYTGGIKHESDGGFD